jgi:hypothetical protein
MSAVLGFDAWRRLSSGNKELTESRRINGAPFGNQGVLRQGQGPRAMPEHTGGCACRVTG